MLQLNMFIYSNISTTIQHQHNIWLNEATEKLSLNSSQNEKLRSLQQRTLTGRANKVAVSAPKRCLRPLRI